MIKLFWNTHNQKKPNTKDEKIIEELDRNYVWGIYHKKNSNLWVYEILKKIKYDIIENESNIEKDDTLIIVDSSLEEKAELYKKLKLICSKIFLFHLGDESGTYDLSQIYKNCNYIWRTFCSNKYFENNRVTCIPIGYKSGVLDKKKIIENINGHLLALRINQVDMICYFNFQILSRFFVTGLRNLIKKLFLLKK